MLFNKVCPPPKQKPFANSSSKKIKGGTNDINYDINSITNFTPAKLFMLKNGSNHVNFKALNCPRIKIGNRQPNYLCGPAHCKGKEFTHTNCQFIHEPKKYNKNINSQSMNALVNWMNKTDKIKKGKDWINPSRLANSDAGNNE